MHPPRPHLHYLFIQPHRTQHNRLEPSLYVQYHFLDHCPPSPSLLPSFDQSTLPSFCSQRCPKTLFIRSNHAFACSASVFALSPIFFLSLFLFFFFLPLPPTSAPSPRRNLPRKGVTTTTTTTTPPTALDRLSFLSQQYPQPPQTPQTEVNNPIPSIPGALSRFLLLNLHIFRQISGWSFAAGIEFLLCSPASYDKRDPDHSSDQPVPP